MTPEHTSAPHKVRFLKLAQAKPDGSTGFEVVFPHETMLFRCESAQDATTWVKLISEVTDALMLSQLEGPSHTAPADHAHAKALVAAFCSENPLCADCGAPQAVWVSINVGVTVCIECCGAHRSLGTHVSQIRSVTLDDWTVEIASRLSHLGNVRVNQILEKALSPTEKPNAQATLEARGAFCRAKCVAHRSTTLFDIARSNSVIYCRRWPHLPSGTWGALGRT
mmetsp:Transcript_46561/g.101073  ORF Transcript_46561/g.101073 Transcript_46561/m.101073 type:complete len:224 (+) Transcript_46561:56-727(+)